MDYEGEFLKGLIELQYGGDVVEELKKLSKNVSWAKGWPEDNKVFWNAEAFMWNNKISKEKKEVIAGELNGSKGLNGLGEERNLDLGCGAGDHVSFFEEQGFDVTGIDISSEMIVLCKKKNLNVQVMDIEDLTFEKESFDGIWAVTSLLHIPKNNLSLVLEKINSILKENGVLYVCLKKGQGEYFISDNESGEKRFFSFWEKEELLDFFGKYFDFIEFREGKLKTTIFLEVFFRKKLK